MNRPIVVWKITSASGGMRARSDDLSTFEAYKVVDEIATLHPREFVIRGGDPFQRPDLFQILEYASRRGLSPRIALPATARLSPDTIARLRRVGVNRVIATVNWSRAPVTPIDGMILDVNSFLTRETIPDLTALTQTLTSLNAATWNVYFPVAKGTLSAEEAEYVFGVLATLQDETRLVIRTVEAPQYRRYLVQRRGNSRAMPAHVAESVRDEVVFIGPHGEVHPSEFLPVAAGNVRQRALSAIIRTSDLFAALADRSNLTGKCEHCEYRRLCGGSRARAWVTSGLLFGPDPLCAYQPGGSPPCS